jgi:hypothetical protein
LDYDPKDEAAPDTSYVGGRDSGPPDLAAEQRPAPHNANTIRSARRPLGRMATFGALGLVGVAAAAIGVTTFLGNSDRGRRVASVKVGPLEDMPDIKNGVPEVARPKTVRVVPTTSAPADAPPAPGSPVALPPGPAAAALSGPAPLPGGFAPARTSEPPVAMSAARPVEPRPAPVSTTVPGPVPVPVETRPGPIQAPAATLPAPPLVAALAPAPAVETTGGLSDGTSSQPSLLGTALPLVAPLPPPAPSRVATLRPERPAGQPRVRGAAESATPGAPSAPAAPQSADDDSVDLFGLKVPTIGAASRSIRDSADALVNAVTSLPGKL